MEKKVLSKIMQLFNDDCLKVLPTIPDNSIDLILTDPPYGTTACKWDSVIPFEPMWKELKRIIKDNSAIALFGSEPFSSHLRLSNLDWFKYDWIWEKQKASNFMGAKYSPLKYHEIISVFSKSSHNYNPQKYKVLEIEDVIKLDKNEIKKLFETKDYDRYGKVDKRKTINNPITNKDHIGNKLNRIRNADDGYRNPKSILKINKDINTNIHPTQKPIALLEYLIKTYTNEGDTVLDFTMGSGSTGVACKNTNRKFIGIEMDKNYFDIAEKRINECLPLS
jgi:site-specific DNA-methyltransferase (adenine-specific)